MSIFDLIPSPVFFVSGVFTVLTIAAIVRSFIRANRLEYETERFWEGS
jgi:hypothetical protein